MARALDLAWRGWGRVQPNPLVGAVVLAAGEAVGEGWHAEYGERHAEPAALEQAGERTRGATLLVTLEPCAHYGRQPPCTDIITTSGIRRVVAAMADPNPIAAGGADRLRAAGVEVEIGLLGQAAGSQNASFLHRVRDPSRPFVGLKLATSLDGRIADSEGSSRWISGEEARAYVHWLRAGFDAIAAGGRTVRADDPSLTVRGSLQPRVAPRRVVFTESADLDRGLTVVRTTGDTPTTVIASTTAPAARLRELEASGVTVLLADDLEAALRSLRQAGVMSLLVEGGGKLAGALLARGLVDRYHWVQSPLWLGEGGVPAVSGLPDTAIANVERWEVAERRPLGGDTLLVMDRRPCSPAW
ncbi:MAG: bifunctional diaminohydroxyphosphoribosylaminopyrimidine deaminase/5-amino-6-(5-phosphoribosylamino)uracil reductase RibD [Gemmatimonadales bacterium]